MIRKAAQSGDVLRPEGKHFGPKRLSGALPPENRVADGKPALVGFDHRFPIGNDAYDDQPVRYSKPDCRRQAIGAGDGPKNSTRIKQITISLRRSRRLPGQ
jgi:hypothetical protein